MDKIQYNLLKTALDASSMRQKAISSNIANVNTAGYKVNKVEFESYLQNAKATGGLQKTHDKHFGVSSIEEIQPTLDKRTTTSVKDNGNNVDIDFEMTEMAANSLYYQSLITQLNAKYSMFRTVIK